MFGLFMLNMWRFLWYSVIVFIVTLLLSLLVNGIVSLALGFFGGGVVFVAAPDFWYKCGIIIGAITGLILSAMLRKSAAEHDDDNCDTLRSVAVVLPLLLAMLLVMGAAIASYIFRGAPLLQKVINVTAYILTERMDKTALCAVLWGVYTSFPIAYFIACMVWYAGCMCTSCGHIFCIGRQLESSSSQDYTQFKTETSRKQVGTLNAGDTKIADVYGDVKTGYYRNVTKTTNNYNCHCCVCNARSHQTETTTERGDWK